MILNKAPIKLSPTVVEETFLAKINLSKLFSYWLALIREAVLDVTAGGVCTATLQTGKTLIEINTHQCLAGEQAAQIKAEIANIAKRKKADFRITINAIPGEFYDYEPHEQRLAETCSFPLFVQKAPVGFLVVGNFNDDSRIADEPFFQQFQSNITDVFTSLWQHNQHERAKYESMVSSVIDGIILCSFDQKIQLINRAAAQILNIQNTRKLTGQQLSVLHVTFLTEFIEEALNNGLHEINKVVQPPKKKTQLIGVHTELLKDVRQREIGWMIVLRDVTTTWQNDQMRSALTIASHEIKTPLSSMSGALDTLLENDLGTLNKQQQRCLEIVRDDVTRLQGLLSDILDLSRLEEGVQFLDRRKEISLDYLVNKVIHTFRSFAKNKNIIIQNKIPKAIPTFKGNRDRLQQVISNLLENGIKYSLPNGKIEINASLENSSLCFWFKDSGVGIPEEEYEAIFDKFKQLDNCPSHSERGYGLGLSIAREIINAAEGKIWVESEVGAGSTFYVTIPV